MDKNAIKKYAVWARRQLIEKVTARAVTYGIVDGQELDDSLESVNGQILTEIERKQRKALIQKIKADGYTQVVEEVAYTWFNRFIAIRFMEVNGYLPSHVRVFSDENGEFKPQILAEAIHLELDGLDRDKVFELKNENKDEELFKYLFIIQCNALSKILPGMFQKIEDYTELLLPDYLLRDGSVIEQLVNQNAGIPELDWTDQVQIIGWLYQYYNSEKKDEVFADLKKNVKITKENIPAATQLFTPDWIVRYMVENSLGRLWLEGHPNDGLKSEWKYYLDEAEQEPEVEKQLADIRKEYAEIKPNQIKCIDPCSGSGHILSYLFDVLMKIYEAYGYTTREAVSSIVESNLYGLDIDDRAAQLAYFSVMMKARQYDRRFFARKDDSGNPVVPQPHVYAIQESNGLDSNVVKYFCKGDSKLEQIMKTLMDDMKDAKEYGSIINVSQVDFGALYARFDEIRDDISIHREDALNQILPFVQCAETLAQKYDVVVTNPPYRGVGDVCSRLQEFVQKYYADSCADLSTVFMESCSAMCKKTGFVAMINIPVWMSLASYKHLRKKIILKQCVVNMLHLGRGMFGSDFGTTAFVIANYCVQFYKGEYKKFFVRQGSVESEDAKHKKFFGGTKDYHTMQELYNELPSQIIAYWATPSFVEAFKSSENINSYAIVFEGLKTRDKERFLRFWFEVASSKWKPYAKGGAYRRWYGNNDYVVNWGDSGEEVRSFKKSSGANFKYYFMPSITYTAMTMSKFTGRYIDKQLFGGGGGGITNTEKLYFILGLVNSKPYDYMISTMKSTVNFEVGQIGKIPVIFGDEENNSQIDKLSLSNVELSKNEWDSFEYSWDFIRHPLVRDVVTVSEAYYLWETDCDNRFTKLKANEEELNRIFINIYGLQEELTPDVEDKDVTVRKADLQRDIRSLISYAVGCMFGRYSLDTPGLAYAGGTWDASKYSTLQPVRNAIIPICDDEYFTEDIVGLFVDFVEVVYGKETLEQNLHFIADALGGNGSAREVIRNYFINDFYADHLKVYQKRPIYWLFDSGKKNGFKCLIYMHRYKPDTIARIRTDYVHEQQARYRTAIEDIENHVDKVSGSDKVKLNKKLNALKAQDDELHSYEEKIHHLADQMISIDLDDGVKHNYEIFKDVLAKIK